MKDVDKLFVGSMPALYDRYLGPFIFEPYAGEIARRVAGFDPQHLLETAAGTGIVTRAMAQALPATASITATDLNQAMVDYAAAQTKARNVAWRQADALALPFPDGSFDPWCASSASCSSRTSVRAIARRCGCSNPAAASSSMSGTASETTRYPMR